MKLAWRSRILNVSLGCILALGMLLCSGCQSWSNMGSPLQSASRVPPPGTGSYSLQGPYYNNPSTATSSTTLSSSAPVVQASSTTAINAPSGANFPTTKFVGDTSVAPGNSNPPASNGSSGVSTAAYTDNGTGGAQVIQASSLGAEDFNQPEDFNGMPAAPPASTNLQWQ